MVHRVAEVNLDRRPSSLFIGLCGDTAKSSPNRWRAENTTVGSEFEKMGLKVMREKKWSDLESCIKMTGGYQVDRLTREELGCLSQKAMLILPIREVFHELHEQPAKEPHNKTRPHYEITTSPKGKSS
jgi:hypothetical protein